MAAWIAASALGFNVISGVLTQVGDIGYSFDKMEGVKFPNDDKDTYKTKHKYPITSGRQEIDVWMGFSTFKKLGIKFAINYEHDGYSIGSITMSLLDTYDWPLWSGTVQANVMALRDLDNGASKVRITVNVQWSRTFQGGGDSAEFELTGANAFKLIRRSSNDLWVRFQ
jgi:hypothetical protein